MDRTIYNTIEQAAAAWDEATEPTPEQIRLTTICPVRGKTRSTPSVEPLLYEMYPERFVDLALTDAGQALAGCASRVGAFFACEMNRNVRSVRNALEMSPDKAVPGDDLFSGYFGLLSDLRSREEDISLRPLTIQEEEPEERELPAFLTRLADAFRGVSVKRVAAVAAAAVLIAVAADAHLSPPRAFSMIASAIEPAQTAGVTTVTRGNDIITGKTIVSGKLLNAVPEEPEGEENAVVVTGTLLASTSSPEPLPVYDETDPAGEEEEMIDISFLYADASPVSVEDDPAQEEQISDLAISITDDTEEHTGEPALSGTQELALIEKAFMQERLSHGDQ